MTLSKEQISKLLGMITSATDDSIDCDGCFDHLAEFADAELSGREIPDALKAVEVHLSQCGCCQDEYEALLTGLQEIASPQD